MKQHSDTKQKYIETASNLFAVKGYHATGLNEIIAQTGSTKGALYYNFPGGKEELAVEALRYSERQILETLQKNMDSNPNPYQAIATNLNHIADQIDQKGKMDELSIGLIALETYNSNDTIRNACSQIFERMAGVYTDSFLKYGYSVEDAKDTAQIINAMLEGALMLCLTNQKGTTLRILARKILALDKKQ